MRATMPADIASGLAIQAESLMAVWEEAAPLMVAHAAESPVAGAWAFDPDTVMYEALDRIGALRCYTARADGVLVGYLSFIVGAHRHHKHLRVANHDAFYVVPEHRGGTGLSLLAHANRALAAEGVDLVVQVVDYGTPFGAMLDRLGYELCAVAYSKRLAPGA